MSQAPTPSPLSEYAGMLWRRKILILLITAALTAPALIISLIQAPTYEASTALALASPSVSADQAVGSSELSDTEMTTQAAVVKGDAVRAAAAARGADGAISTSLTNKSNLMTLTATGSSPDAAARTANAYADAYIQLRVNEQQQIADLANSQITPQIDGLRQRLSAISGAETSSGQLATLEGQQTRIELQRAMAPSSTAVVVRAVPPSEASSPLVLRNTLVGLVLGLALGIGVALLTGSFRRPEPTQAGADGDAPDSVGSDSSEPTPADAERTFRMPRPTPPGPDRAPRQHPIPSPTGRTPAFNYSGTGSNTSTDTR